MRTSTGECWRVRFSGKKEVRFRDPNYRTLDLIDEHPLLMDHLESLADLHVASPASSPRGLTEALGARVAEVTQGWRTLEHYRQGLSAPERVLATGFGLLLQAPRGVVAAAERLLEMHGIACTVFESRLPPSKSRLLLFEGGKSFVVASAFGFERC